MHVQYPVAIGDDGVVYRASHAPRTRRYTCPACGSGMILKRGIQRVAHFAHEPSATCDEGEATRLLALHLLRDVIAHWVHGNGEAPLIQRACDRCGRTLWQSLPPDLTGASTESAGADLILVTPSGPWLAILMDLDDDTLHPTDPTRSGTPWIVLSARAIMHNPVRWTPIRSSGMSLRCSTCLQASTADTGGPALTPLPSQAAAQAVVEYRRVLQQLLGHGLGSTALPTTYYRYLPVRCWLCGGVAVVYWWPGMREGNPPLQHPVPHTIRMVPISVSRFPQAWFSTCPQCHAALPHQPPPQVTIELADTPASWQRDMAGMSAYWHAMSSSWQASATESVQ